VVAVSPGIIDDFRQWGFDRSDIQVITNGYDEDDFKEQDESYSTLPPDRFTFHLYGTISPNAPPEPFFRALSAWIKANPELADKVEVSHRGAVIGVDLEHLLQKYELPKRVTSLGYAPHWFAVKELQNAHALVISVADRPGVRSNIPGRIYECLRSRRPILAFVPPDGAAAGILQGFEGVRLVEPTDKTTAVEAIDSLVTGWQNSQPPQEHARKDVTGYSRKSLTEKLIAAFTSSR